MSQSRTFKQLSLVDIIFFMLIVFAYIGLYTIHYYSYKTMGMARYVTVISTQLDLKFNVMLLVYFATLVLVTLDIIFIFCNSMKIYNLKFFDLKKYSLKLTFLVKFIIIFVHFYILFLCKDYRDYYFLLLISILILFLLLICELIKFFIIKNYKNI